MPKDKQKGLRLFKQARNDNLFSNAVNKSPQHFDPAPVLPVQACIVPLTSTDFIYLSSFVIDVFVKQILAINL